MKRLLTGLIALTVFFAACKHSNKNSAQPPANLQTSDPSSPVSPAVAGTESAAGPVMKFDSVTHDFGKIHKGDKVTYNFIFTNVGKTPLIVSDAVASCGCTKPTKPSGPVNPGQKGQISVTFNSEAQSVGLKDKMITITANTDPRQSVVHLVGEVLEKK